jgi:hypothetical protein
MVQWEILLDQVRLDLRGYLGDAVLVSVEFVEFPQWWFARYKKTPGRNITLIQGVVNDEMIIIIIRFVVVVVVVASTVFGINRRRRTVSDSEFCILGFIIYGV